MTDYGHPITFGLSLDPSLDLVDDNTRLAQDLAEHRRVPNSGGD